MQTEVYVAMSIHGSNCFITANKTIEMEARPSFGQAIEIDGWQFSASAPRDGNTSIRGAQKLIWPALNEGSSGTPSHNPEYILGRFHELRDKGWHVDDARFITRHKIGQPQKSASADTVRAVQPKTGYAAQRAEFGIDCLSPQQVELIRWLKSQTLPVSVGDPITERVITSLACVDSLAARGVLLLSEDKKQITEFKLPDLEVQPEPAPQTETQSE
jgi:hypothetical protein